MIVLYKMLPCELSITQSACQTKDWRKNSSWYIDGKHNECELYQRNLVEKITNQTCNKTNYRINLLTKEFLELRCPLKNESGFEWSENFDGVVNKENLLFYINLKMICDEGGSQTRSLREVYHFVNSQLEIIYLQNTNNIYFVNILDGDTSHKNNNKFKYLLNKTSFENVKKYVFVGDMYEFHIWWSSLQL